MQTFRISNDKRKEGKRRKADQNIKYNESCPEILQTHVLNEQLKLIEKESILSKKRPLAETSRF